MSVQYVLAYVPVQALVKIFVKEVDLWPSCLQLWVELEELNEGPGPTLLGAYDDNIWKPAGAVGADVGIADQVEIFFSLEED